MDKELQEKLQDACWAAHTLFNRNKATGSSANMSFVHQGHIFITASGTCFGRLKPEDFTELDMEGNLISGRKASKEFPLHQGFYKKSANIGAVIHTHSYYGTLWSCLSHENDVDIVPRYTPYLKMKVGNVGLVPYAAPGSKELFAAFEKAIEKSDAFLLANHGPVVPGKSILEAFYGLEELEDSCRIAWEAEGRSEGLRKIE